VCASVVRQHKRPLFVPNVGNPVPVTRKHAKDNLLRRLLNITTKEQRHSSDTRELNTNLISAMKLLSIFSDRYE